MIFASRFILWIDLNGFRIVGNGTCIVTELALGVTAVIIVAVIRRIDLNGF